MYLKSLALLMVILFAAGISSVYAQSQKSLLLSEGIAIGINSYQIIQAKRNYLRATTAMVQQVKDSYLPNVIASVQQSYGTINGQFGPLIATEGLGIASGGPVNGAQRWDAGFGSLYLLNAHWEVFNFGRLKSRLLLANALVKKDSADVVQEEFVHGVKVAGAYLNLLGAQRLMQNAQSNLQRALSVRASVLAKTRSGLVPGVDSSIANAEVSRAKLMLIETRNAEQQISSQLRQLLNDTTEYYTLDTSFFSKIPIDFNSTVPVEQNPQVRFYQTRIDESTISAAYLKKSILPGINLFGIFQARGSGFDYNYTANNDFKYSGSYLDGIKPVRSNYVTGVTLAWNIISPLKIKQQIHAQQFITEAYKNEFGEITNQLKSQLMLADERIQNSLQAIREVPLQYKAASDAYLQKSVLYNNGLADIVDLQQALYLLNRAETDVSVANLNVWQALLIKSAATGDFELFRKQIQ